MARAAPLSIFLSYSHRDEGLRQNLEKHLSLLRREGLVSISHDRMIRPGEVWQERLSDHLETADLVLLLVSADFLASDYCFETEMTRALERHDAGSARVVPILLRECDWKSAPFARLQGLPLDLRPVVSWDDEDAAWTDVAKGLRGLVEELRERRGGEGRAGLEPPIPTSVSAAGRGG